MEVSEKDIETLREAVDGCGGPSYTQALAILDRLTPPALEPDEATKIAREFVARYHARAGYPMMAELARKGEYDKDRSVDVEYLRQAIAELIASKDGEIERLAGINSQLVAEHNAMNQDGARLESELATLQAENERLKDTISDLGVDLDEWQRCERAAGNIPSPKAAERNTAEPLVSLASGEPKIGGWTSDAKYAPNEPAKTHVWPATHDDACSEIKATETTPDVVVTQADCQREQWARNIASYTEGQARNHVYECAINLLTEAEARGRLEALDFGENASELYFKALREKWSPVGFFSELKRMMMGEK